MKYDGSAGVRRRVLLDAAAVGEVDGDDLRRLGGREVDAVASAIARRRRARSRRRRGRPSAARRRPRRGRTARRAQRWAAYSSSSHARDDLEVELADRLGEPLDLEALHRDERRDELRAEPARRDGRRPRARRAPCRGRPAAVEPGVGIVHPVGVAHDRLGRVEPALDPVEPGEQQRGDDQVRAGRAVAGADLDARARAALVRDAAERGAVVVAPVRVGRREAVGQDALVGVDRRPEQRLQPRRVLDHPGDELRGERAQPVRAALVGERVATVLAASERCTWKPEPPWSANGRPMKVASSPSRTAISFTAALSMKARSAASRAPSASR